MFRSTGGGLPVRTGRLIALGALVAVIALVASGCGGGDTADGPGTVGTATIAGTVYAPSVTVAAVDVAQANSQGVPVSNCPVEVQTEPGGQRLASGATDAAGRYQFRGLSADTTVVVEARVPGVGPLMARAQLRDGSCRADVDEQTTLAVVCARHGDREFAGEVADACLQYQARNGYRFGQTEGHRPDFADAGDVDEVAGTLLAAAAVDALERARDTRAEADCECAMHMLQAHLRERYENHTGWTEETVQRLAEALREGSVTEERAAGVLSRVMQRQITAEQVQRALRYLWERLGIDAPERDPEVPEVVAALCVASGESQTIRLQTQAQVQALVQQFGE